MNSLTVDIRKKLVELGLGSDGTISPEAQWSIHANAYPATPAQVICIFSTNTQYQYVIGARHTLDTDMFQIRVRGLSPIEADTKMKAVHKALQRIGLFTMPEQTAGDSPIRYLDILTTSGPSPLGRDGKDWFSYVVSMKALREEISPAS